MELTVNQFSKGLQLDTHPMVQGNDSLSDALNATFVTMNGNEVVLQNDMGNRRVDNAFLPPGYLPVGIKEYGGIIYVAAYNPITNKSQIGSFPSPEKKISDVDDESLGGEFDFDIFLNELKGNISLDNYLGGIKVLNTDSFMIPLTGDTSLRAGDKFAVWANSTLANQGGLAELSNYITNYKNVRDNKAISPKNRKYTLLLGILNSQNEFVDITKTLCRWKKDSYGKWNPKKYDYSYSDIYKFNDEYFIPDGFTNINFSETIKDSKLIKERLQMAANTYAYKLIGPLYLKANLNHIYNFNYTIYGTYDDGLASLLIEGYLTYNCPDGVRNIINNSNENYLTFEEGIPTFRGFDLLLNGNGSEGISTPYPSSYNPNANLYTVKIVKEYSEIQANPETKDDGTLKFGLTSTTYNYIIGVLADKDINDIYLRGLSVKGQIDLALLGSGKVFFTGWRFYNNPGVKTTLYYSINSYPKKNEEYKNLIIKFTDVSNSSNIFTIVRDRLDNGAIELDWNEYGIVERTLYRVEVTYDIFNKDTSWTSTETIIETDIEGNNIERWFLSTPLFNDFYLADAGVPDYCDFNKADLSEEKFLRAKDDFEALMIVNLEGSGSLKPVKPISPTISYKGGLTGEDQNISYICEHKFENLEIHNESIIKIKNEEYYPKNININNNNENALKISSISDLCIGNNNIENGLSIEDAFKKSIEDFNNGSYYEKGNPQISKQKFDETCLLERTLNINNNTITGTITYRDIYKGYTNRLCKDFEYVFDRWRNILDKLIPNKYFGLTVDWANKRDIFEGSDGHYFAIANSDKFIVKLPAGNGIESSNWEILNKKYSDGLEVFNLSETSGKIYDEFDDLVKNSDLTFGFIFVNRNNNEDPASYFVYDDDSSNTSITKDFNLPRPNEGKYDIDKINDYLGDKVSSNYARVWWKGENNWSMFENFFYVNNTKYNDDNYEQVENNIKNSFKEFIINNILDDYVYSIYDYYSDPEGKLGIYLAPSIKDGGDYIFTKPYKDIVYKLGVKYELTDNSENVLIISTPKIGNLEFKRGNFSENYENNEILILLSSDNEFENNIHLYDPDEPIKYIYLPKKVLLTGVNKDTILIKDKNTDDLIKVSSEYPLNVKISKGYNINVLLYKPDSEVTLWDTSLKIFNNNYRNSNLKYFVLRNKDTEDSEVVLIYDKVYVVKCGESFDNNLNGRVHSDSIISTGRDKLINYGLK